jgi:cytoskeletal protein CcmA (bactofilin family)
MWKKESSSTPETTTPTAWSPECSGPARKPTHIGEGSELEGTIRGRDDILLNGRLTGKVELPENCVTVGIQGSVEGDIWAKVVIVEGAVKGNIRAEERVVLHRSAQLVGNIKCERVTVEDGARVNGAIDMSVETQRKSEVKESLPLEEEEAFAH